jgi:hypothetical protein
LCLYAYCSYKSDIRGGVGQLFHSVQCLHGEGGRSDATELFYSPCVSQSSKVVEDRQQLGRVVDE